MIKNKQCMRLSLRSTYTLISLFSKNLSTFALKDFYMNRKFAHSLNPTITSFENQVINMKNLKEFEGLFQHLIEPKEEDLPKINENIEFLSLILLEKIITLQSVKVETESLSSIYNLYYSLIYTYLQKFRQESLLLLIHIISREPSANKRIFRIFDFIIMRTAFADKLGDDEIMQLVEDCDKFYKIIEEDSFLEIFEKIEKILFEKHQKELKFSPENLSKLVFIYSTHGIGSEGLYQKIYSNFLKNCEIMVTKEIIIIVWSLNNSGHFKKKRLLNPKLKKIIENDLEKVDEYYKNLYYYSLKKDNLKSILFF